MSQSAPPPTARPITTAITPVRVEPLAPAAVPVGGGLPAIAKRTTDRFAIASAVCGLAAIIPVVSQVIGLGLGITSIVRLRRAKRAGVDLAGKGWAITGIVSSGIALVGWVALFVAMIWVGSSFLSTAGSLDALLKHPP